MIKLLMGITLSETGGSQQIVYDIIANLPESMYEITLLTAPNGRLLNRIRELNKSRKNRVIIVTWKCLKRNISPLCDLAAFIKLFIMLRKNRYDVTHFHSSKMGIIGRTAARLAGVPKVYFTVHGWGLNKDSAGRLYWILSSMERFACRFADTNVFVSKYDMEQGVRNRWACPAKSCLIYNGVGAEKLPPAGHRQISNTAETDPYLPVIAFVARLAEPKEPLFAIRVSAHLIKDGCSHKMLIIGQGPLYDDCKNLIEELKLNEHILLLGDRNDVIAILKESDIFCLFSSREGLPVSILEAMACGLPVIANSAGGIPELIEHGRTGYLIDTLDVNLAAKYFADLICNKEKRVQMGNASRSRAAEKFGLANMIAQYRELYEREIEISR